MKAGPSWLYPTTHRFAPKYGLRGLGDTGMNVQIMEELGYTVLQVNPETGKKKKRVDWTKTRAVANREMMIYLNIKGRNQHKVGDEIIDGLVDPADKYELEEQIITDLYGLRDKESGKRIIAWALRAKDALPLGLGGHTPRPVRDIQNPAISSIAWQKAMNTTTTTAWRPPLANAIPPQAQFSLQQALASRKATIPIASSVKLMSPQPSQPLWA